MVLTASGAAVAESAPASFDVTAGTTRARVYGADSAKSARAAYAQQAEYAQQREVQVTAAGVTAARATAARATLARAKVLEADRIARSAERKAVAKKQAAAAALEKAEADRRAREQWVMPVGGAVFTSGYGWRWGRLHAGDDFGTPVGTPLKAMTTGTVTFAGWQGGYGNKIEIEYWDGTVSVFGHLSQIRTSVGTRVAPGDIVGLSGNTGHSTGPHLHLEIHPEGGSAVDPAPWLHDHGLQ